MIAGGGGDAVGLSLLDGGCGGAVAIRGLVPGKRGMSLVLTSMVPSQLSCCWIAERGFSWCRFSNWHLKVHCAGSMKGCQK